MDSNNTNKNSENLGKKIDKNSIVFLTKDGLEERKNRLNELINDIRPQVLKELSEARSQGDLSENADYDSAKNKQAEVESEILSLKELLTHVQIFEDDEKNKKKIVNIGSTVSYKNLLDKKEYKVKIVSNVEANPLKEIPWVGIDSPLGKILINSKIGEEKKVQTLKKKYDIKILKIN